MIVSSRRSGSAWACLPQGQPRLGGVKPQTRALAANHARSLALLAGWVRALGHRGLRRRLTLVPLWQFHVKCSKRFAAGAFEGRRFTWFLYLRFAHVSCEESGYKRPMTKLGRDDVGKLPQSRFIGCALM
jgi:hypothetical protein